MAERVSLSVGHRLTPVTHLLTPVAQFAARRCINGASPASS
jgi:hypothetical protein